MSLCETWLESELEKGKTQRQAMDEMSKACDYKVSYVHVLRWRNGERNPRPEVRRYMMERAIPYMLKRTDWTLKEYVEALL